MIRFLSVAFALVVCTGLTVVVVGANGALALDDWLTPAVTTLAYLSLAGVCGGLSVRAFCVSQSSHERRKARDFSALCAVILTVVAGLAAIFQDSWGSDTAEWLAISGLAAAAALLSFLSDTRSGFVVTATLVFATFVVLGVVHSPLRDNYSALSSRFVLSGSVVLWIGTVIARVTSARTLEHQGSAERAGVRVRWFSSLSTCCLGGMVLGSVILFATRISFWREWFTQYGVFTLVTSMILLALGVIVFGRRRAFLAQNFDRIHVRRLLLVHELLLGGLAAVFSAVLLATSGSSRPSLSISPLIDTPAQILTGRTLPPEPGMVRWVFPGAFDTVWLCVCCAALLWYGRGVYRLRSEGTPWPRRYSVAWTAGVLVLLIATNGGLRVYAMYVFSARVVLIMLLSMVVPLLLAGGSPGRLAALTVGRQSNGSRVLREWIREFSQSKGAALLTTPVMASLLLIVSIWIFLVGPLLRPSVTSLVWGEWMTINLVCVGVLAVGSMRGNRPVFVGKSLLSRLTPVVLVAGFLVGVGFALIQYNGLLVSDWFGAMGRTWGESPGQDQRYSVYPMLILGGVSVVGLAVRSLRSSSLTRG